MRRILRSLIEDVFERHDSAEFLFVIIAICVGIAYIVTLLGLTASAGEFVAVFVVSSGAHRKRALQYVMPFQVVFAAVFFASIGMLLDPAFVVDHAGEVLLFALVVVVLKAAVVFGSTRALHQPAPVAASSALLLAQIGEFSFVLSTVGTAAGLTLAGRADGEQMLIAVAVLLIALTPVLHAAGGRLARRLDPVTGPTTV